MHHFEDTKLVQTIGFCRISYKYIQNTSHTHITNKDELERNMPSMSNCVCRSTTTACRQPLPYLCYFYSVSARLRCFPNAPEVSSHERTKGMMCGAVQCGLLCNVTKATSKTGLRFSPWFIQNCCKTEPRLLRQRPTARGDGRSAVSK